MKRQVFLKHSSKETKEFLLEMKKHGYISSLAIIPCGTKEKLIVGLNGRLTKCGAICPRFRYKAGQIQEVANRLKPARQFGHVLFDAGKNVVDQKEATEQRAGGSIMGFFY